MSSLALSEKALKEKWLRNYQEEIFANKEKREQEVNFISRILFIYNFKKSLN